MTMIAAIALFTMLMVEETEAASNDERLAEMFSPILILTEETGHKWGDIRISLPAPEKGLVS
ncbi:MAG: hypothetical protein J4F35_15620 [Candidatus Latescibacteria bacterium]|nr:hypothetical protein [Candidatus Latescibacterota bacterium]